ncbi:MAG: maleylpyruvate isomerase N-terminal domain-containing protein [Bryobacteraceae bacterium]
MTINIPHSSLTECASTRAGDLADRLEKGAGALAALASTLTQAQWRTPVPGDGRRIGVIVHHVASVYPLEIELAQQVAAGQPITGVAMEDVHAMNAKHAKENSEVNREETLALLARNSAVAAAAIRALSDEALARAAPVSLYGDAILTCQFVLEDHAVRHSYHHLSLITRALQMA